MENKFQYIINTPIGKLGIKINNGKLTNIIFITNPSFLEKNVYDPLINAIKEQLEQYFINPKYKFTLPLDPQGTEFQKRTWQALCDIPCGNVKTYGELSKQLHTSPRAIGNACRRNPIPIIIPCHRIIAKDSLGGYASELKGRLMDIKKSLLILEMAQ